MQVNVAPPGGFPLQSPPDEPVAEQFAHRVDACEQAEAEVEQN